MHARKLGTQGLVVSELGLGCMSMTYAYGVADPVEARATVRRAFDLGVTFFDTAEVYGPYTNEELVGPALRDVRDKVVIATKFGFNIEDGKINGFDSRPENVRRACEASLLRLGTDHIDLLYQHRVDPNVPIEDTVGAMAALVKQGKVRYLGLSEAGPATIRRAHKVHPISALQSEYSLWTRDHEGGSLETCRELGIGFVAYSPLGRGYLTGTFTSPESLEAGDWRRSNPRFTSEAMIANQKLVAPVKELASKKGCTPGQIALAWLLARGEDIVPIPGTNKPARIDENLGALKVNATKAQLDVMGEEIDAAQVAGTRYPADHMPKVGI